MTQPKFQKNGWVDQWPNCGPIIMRKNWPSHKWPSQIFAQPKRKWRKLAQPNFVVSTLVSWGHVGLFCLYDITWYWGYSSNYKRIIFGSSGRCFFSVEADFLIFIILGSKSVQTPTVVEYPFYNPKKAY
jgi:hypothetical protein